MSGLSAIKKVSVIIPIYNAQAYLKECLTSVQESELEDLEVIMVDDGSTDGSREICKLYTRRDDRFTLYEQDNSGAGVARNLGMRYATGKYLHFLDADDYISPKLYSNSVNLCEKYELDFCAVSSNGIDFHTGESTPLTWLIQQSRIPDKVVFSHLDVKKGVFNVLGYAPWDKIYNKSFIQKTALCFQNLPSVNDRFFTVCAYIEAKRISVLTDQAYVFYRKDNPNSLDGSRGKYPLNVYKSLIAIREYLIKHEYFGELEQDFVNNALHSVLMYLFNRTGQAFDEAWQFYQREGFTELGFTDKDSEYFYDKSEWNFFIKEVYGKSIRDYFVVELDKCKRIIDEDNNEIQRLKSSFLRKLIRKIKKGE